MGYYCGTCGTSTGGSVTETIVQFLIQGHPRGPANALSLVELCAKVSVRENMNWYAVFWYTSIQCAP